MTPARAATTDATLAGRVVADGTKEALPRICVTAEEFDNGRGGSQYTTTTGIDGRYSMTVGGGYDVLLQFEDCNSHVYAPEYFNNTPSLSQATRFQVAPGGMRTINVGLAVGSVLTGRLNDSRSGEVVRGVTVRAQLPDTLMASASATSGPAGVYKITGLAAGSYHVWTEAFPNDPTLVTDLYGIAANAGVTVYPQQSHLHRYADLFTYPSPYDPVVVGRAATVTLNERLEQGGTITGRVTRASDGLAL